MTVKSVLTASLCFLLWAPFLASAEDARLPYNELWRLQQAQLDLSRIHTNLTLVLQMRSTLPDVKAGDIKASIESKSGSIPVKVGTDGVFSIPMRDDWKTDDTWMVVNQPHGTMQLNWHAGLAPAVARQLTNSIHYGKLMRCVRECDEVQEAMREFFPAAPRLTAVGLRLTFRSNALAPAAIIHAKAGTRVLPADALDSVLIPIDPDLIEEDPILTVTESPLALEIVTRKLDSP